MTLRLKIVLALLGTVVVLMIIFSLFAIVGYLKKGNQAAETNTQNQQQPLPEQSAQTTESVTNVPIFQEPVTPPVSKPGDELIPIVLPFVERFGSYSNQGNFENLTDLLPFMTETMQGWAHEQIKEQTQKAFQSLYRGVTTKALSYTLSSYEAQKGVAEMKVSTQRKELIGTTSNARVYNQDVVIKLKKDDGVWLVDSAYWQ